MALAIIENADPKKSDEKNYEIGKRLGYVITDYYKKAIWAMDNPDAEGRAVVFYALENSQTRAKYMSHAQLSEDVRNCRASFSN